MEIQMSAGDVIQASRRGCATSWVCGAQDQELRASGFWRAHFWLSTLDFLFGRSDCAKHLLLVTLSFLPPPPHTLNISDQKRSLHVFLRYPQVICGLPQLNQTR
jgi:hypothetical protein